MNIFISVGEVSGDLHGANLINRFREYIPASCFTGMGGDAMAAAGQIQEYHVRDMAILGIAEVIKHLPFIRKAFKNFEMQFSREKIDMVILIDYPGFNLRLAKIAKKYNIPVFYYICPQMWAWGKKRIHKIRRYVNHSFVIFDFEKTFFDHYNAPATFIGHPIREVFDQIHPRGEDIKKDKKLLALLPGSRKHEVEGLLPVQLDAAKKLIKQNPDWDYVVAVAENLDSQLYSNIPAERSIKGRHYDILGAADAAIVASGTATIETALFEVPYVITYKVNSITWLLGKLLVKIPFIGMVNIISGSEVVPELLQSDLTVDKLLNSLNPLISEDSDKRTIQIEALKKIKNRLGGSNASKIAVEKILEEINGEN